MSLAGADVLRSFVYGYDDALALAIEVWTEAAEADLVYTRLSYLSVHDQRVPALLTEPLGEERRRPAILVQHGGGDSKDERHIRLVSRQLARAGFIVLSIDAPDHGERARDEGPPLSQARRRLFYRQRDNRIQNLLDLRRGVDLLRARPRVDPARLGYWGISMGASIGVALLAADERISSACLVLGGASRRPAPEGIDPRHYEMSRLLLDPVLLAPALEGRPVLMLNGSRDATISREAAEELFAALPDAKRLEWFRAGHQLTAGMIRASVSFFQETLVARQAVASPS
jgi:uncharacterized protein